MCCFALAFIEAWGMVEQPLILIRRQELWPLSLMLNDRAGGELGLGFAGAVSYAVPALLLYLMNRDRLMNSLGEL